MNTSESFPVGCHVVLTKSQYAMVAGADERIFQHNVQDGTEGVVTKIIGTYMCEVLLLRVRMRVRVENLRLVVD